MRSARHPNFTNCPAEAALDIIGGKWKSMILFHLLDGTLRFNELRRRMPNVTQRMLTTQLRELEDDDLVARKVYPQVPPKVEYSLTARGLTLRPVLEALRYWGQTQILDRNTLEMAE